MFENRSFDNLMSHLYDPARFPPSKASSARSCPTQTPDWVEHGGSSSVPYGIPGNMATPVPYPGEKYHHVSTQPFGILDEPNRGQADPKGTINAPVPGQVQTMYGFIAECVSRLPFENSRLPRPASTGDQVSRPSTTSQSKDGR